MATELTARTDGRLPATSIPPRMSGPLAYLVEMEESVWRQHSLPPLGAEKAEANTLLREYEHMCREPDPRAVTAWCARISMSIANPLPKEHFLSRVSGIFEACKDIPAAVWTASTATEAMGKFHFFPSGAEVRAFLMPYAVPLWRKLHGLRRVSAHGEPQNPEPADRSPAAQEAVADIVRAFVAERSFNRSDQVEARPPVKPAYFSDGQLLVEYEKLAAEGHEWARTRVAMLRNKMKTDRPESVR